ncbi:efflux transporter outer membrane subunit [Aliifodinibius sp. S!AR15-10]|uniref:efflux transporter outer membrane subunit n=1 Tax=Aliifodinibius sp. S!AR15-10 TaxID=2950437 RepID=UPI002865CB79|nr:efflux transporter outer membrane subunit [Aliifodinibius sp. S!AR15-10]MDR8394031.1 efflux transporter outer membrane subunit [Aliifodinibius sp. S!AR15-10]
MLFKSSSNILAALLLTIFLSSCIATKPYKKPDLQAETETLYPFDRVEMDSTTLSDMPWQEVFKDPTLRDLIREALNNNLDLQDAIQQIRVAEANFYQGQMNMLPSLYLNGSVGYGELSDNANQANIPASEQYTASLSSSWELDVWGKLTSAKKASYAALLQTEAIHRAIQTSLIANVANAYYQLLALDRQLEITRKTVENRLQDVETVKSLKESSMVTGVSVQQSIANRYAAEVTIPEFEQQITELENDLSILLGRTPGTIERSSLAEQEPIDSLSTGVPAQLLRNRPDILAAEYSFRSAFELTNNARAYFYPSFTLTAEGGYQSLSTQDLFQPGSVFYNIIGGLTQPLFNNGRNLARLKQSKAQQQQALLQLRSSILNAGREVSNALSQFQNAEQKIELREQQVNALENAVEYSRELLQFGEANYIDVLTAQQSLLTTQLGSVNDKLQQLTAGVSLYRALGGGWDKSTELNDSSVSAEKQE